MSSQPDALLAVAQHAIWIVALASAPILLPAMVTGLVTGIIQAVTSINEASLSFVPKLIVIALCLVLFGGAIMGLIADFTVEIFGHVSDITR